MSYDEMTELLEYRDRVASEIEALDLLDRERERQDVSWAGVASEQSGDSTNPGQTPGKHAAPADDTYRAPWSAR